MQKITSKNLSKRLLQYGAMSAAALGVADMNGQIVYTDVDPDEDLLVADSFIVDMTGATNEFNVSNPDGLAGGNAALIFPSSGGAFVGTINGAFMYPALLAEGDAIDGAAAYTTAGIRGDMNYYGCAYSDSQWCGTVVDGYIGLSFQLAGNTHYGWIRMNTDVNGTNIMTVKDFAYNSVPDEAINAGQSLSVDDLSPNTFTHSFNSTTDQLILESSSLPMTSIELYNILGQRVINQSLSQSNEIIDMSGMTDGIYLAKVSIQGQSRTIKILKQ